MTRVNRCSAVQRAGAAQVQRLGRCRGENVMKMCNSLHREEKAKILDSMAKLFNFYQISRKEKRNRLSQTPQVAGVVIIEDYGGVTQLVRKNYRLEVVKSL